MKIRMKFVLQDCWIGIYWRSTQFTKMVIGKHAPEKAWAIKDDVTPVIETHHEVFVCLLPTLPIIVSWTCARPAPLATNRHYELQMSLPTKEQPNA